MAFSYTPIFCPTGFTQSGTPDIRNLSAQVREEATEADCRGDGIMNGEGLLGVWDTADSSYFVQVLRTKFVVL